MRHNITDEQSHSNTRGVALPFHALATGIFNSMSRKTKGPPWRRPSLPQSVPELGRLRVSEKCTAAKRDESSQACAHKGVKAFAPPEKRCAATWVTSDTIRMTPRPSSPNTTYGAHEALTKASAKLSEKWADRDPLQVGLQCVYDPIGAPTSNQCRTLHQRSSALSTPTAKRQRKAPPTMKQAEHAANLPTAPTALAPMTRPHDKFDGVA